MTSYLVHMMHKFSCSFHRRGKFRSGGATSSTTMFVNLSIIEAYIVCIKAMRREERTCSKKRFFLSFLMWLCRAYIPLCIARGGLNIGPYGTVVLAPQQYQVGHLCIGPYMVLPLTRNVGPILPIYIGGMRQATTFFSKPISCTKMINFLVQEGPRHHFFWHGWAYCFRSYVYMVQHHRTHSQQLGP